MQKTNNALKSVKPVFIILVVFALLLLPATAFAEDADTSSTSSDPDAIECSSDSDTDSTETETSTDPDQNDEDEDLDEAGLNNSDNESSEPETDSGSNTTDEAGLSDENGTEEDSSGLDPTADETPPDESPDETSDDSPSDSTPQENPEPSPEPVSDEDPSELTTETNSADSDEAESNTAAADEGSETGNSYVVEITPDAVVDHEEEDNYVDGEGNEIPNAGESADFTVTFTEVGDSELGSARVDIPDGFTGIDFNAEWLRDGIETNSGQQWEGKLDNRLVYLRAVDEASKLLKGDSVSVTFNATTPDTTGVYQFETRAWTEINDDDADFDTDGTNHMATGYVDPVVIVGKPIADFDGLDGMSYVEHYVQVDDINLDLDGGIYNPIGYQSDPFKGSYHGNGYTIENLTINNSSDENGLFGYIDDAWLVNVTLENVNITGGNDVGGLVGFSENSTIINSSVEGDVNGGNRVGGLVGRNEGSYITGSHATGSVNGNNDVGGLVGRNEEAGVIADSWAGSSVTGTGQRVGGLAGNNHALSTINNSYAMGNVESTDREVGGLVGQNHGGTIKNSWAEGEAKGDRSVGGLVGSNNKGNLAEGGFISSSYATGNVIVPDGNDIGGLVGRNSGSLIDDSYATGAVEGSDRVGGLVGYNSSDINECYATGTVEGSDRVGGLIGSNEGGTITGSHATVNVTASGNNVGGLVGWNSDANINNSHATGEVLGGSTVGGLIGRNSGSTVENCSAEGNVTGASNVGGLIGFIAGTTIANSHASGDVEGTTLNYHGGLVGNTFQANTITESYATGKVYGGSFVGGLVGDYNGGTITNSYATGNVIGSGNNVGGLVGKNSGGTITSSYATGNIEGNDYVGGLVGYTSTNIDYSYATGDVTGEDRVGGLAGYTSSGVISYSYTTASVTGNNYVGGLVGLGYGSVFNSYATGSVTGNNYVGGLVGSIHNGITNSYSIGSVSGTGDYVGGLVGDSDAQVDNSFFDSTSNPDTALDNGHGEPKTTAELKTLITFSGAGWSIDGEDGTYPVLLWQLDAINGNIGMQKVALNGASELPIWYMEGDPDFDPDPDPDDPDQEDPDSGPADPVSFLPDAGLGTLGLMTFSDVPALPVSFPGDFVPGPAAKALVYPLADGTAPIVTADFVSGGTALDLAKAISLYLELLQDFEENAESMSEAEYAVTVIELAVAWAGIQALEARLSSEGETGFDLSALLEAYENALQQLSDYGDYLSEEQLTAVSSVLDAVAEVIEELGTN